MYEGDTVQFVSLVEDADGNQLDATYEITSPSGIKNSYKYVWNAPYPKSAPVIRMVEAGTWTVKLTVSDRIADAVSVTKKVLVLPLSIEGEVMHTDKWDENRKAYNLKVSGNEHSPRGYSVFWAGERFVLEGKTTITGTQTAANRVEVTMGDRTVNLSAAASLNGVWKGEMWDESFQKLSDGEYSFIFTAYYSNGVVKKVSVSIEIRGNVLQLTGVHRVQ